AVLSCPTVLIGYWTSKTLDWTSNLKVNIDWTPNPKVDVWIGRSIQ
ncbi:30800_t:CDS:1, partial [Racocetra persica]